MLVLSRKANQRIMVGENIEIVVVSIQGGRVQLGFNAPRLIPIDRSEKRRTVDEDAARAQVEAT